MTEPTQVSQVPRSFQVHPLFEGCNVGTWIGFKHILYLLEDGVRQYLCATGLPTGGLFEQHGICTEVTAVKARLIRAVRCDDLLQVDVTAKPHIGQGMPLQVRLSDAHGVVRATGAITVTWRRDEKQDGSLDPAFLRDRIVDRVAVDAAPPPPDAMRMIATLIPAGKCSHVVAFRVPYPWCSYNFWLQASGYHRLVESMVDLFLEERGISIGSLLRERRWIPVVSQVELSIRADVRLEETLFAAIIVDDVLKDVVFKSSLRCYVIRGGQPLLVAEASIDHAYVEFTTRAVEPRVATFDARVRRALAGDQS